MTALPLRYRWLAAEPGPRLLKEALALYGTRELAGPASDPVIMGWAREIGLTRPEYPNDGVPWCGLFMAVVAQRSGRDMPDTPLWARAWAKWGEPATVAKLGDVLVFSRNGGGHVGVYVGEDRSAFHVLGGNQSDAVTITRISRDRLIAARHPKWLVAEPANRRVVRVGPVGAISSNEA